MRGHRSVSKSIGLDKRTEPDEIVVIAPGARGRYFRRPSSSFTSFTRDSRAQRRHIFGRFESDEMRSRSVDGSEPSLGKIHRTDRFRDFADETRTLSGSVDEIADRSNGVSPLVHDKYGVYFNVFQESQLSFGCLRENLLFCFTYNLKRLSPNRGSRYIAVISRSSKEADSATISRVFAIINFYNRKFIYIYIYVIYIYI